MSPPSVPFYAMQCTPGRATPETPLLYVVEYVHKGSGPHVLAYLCQRTGRSAGRWTRWRYLFALAEITPAPACFIPSHPFPVTLEDWRRNGD